LETGDAFRFDELDAAAPFYDEAFIVFRHWSTEQFREGIGLSARLINIVGNTCVLHSLPN
jgi:hypothetical protein